MLGWPVAIHCALWCGLLCVIVWIVYCASVSESGFGSAPKSGVRGSHYGIISMRWFLPAGLGCPLHRATQAQWEAAYLRLGT